MQTQAKVLVKEPLNHRTRVGIERREIMRARLVKAALLVFSVHGVDAKVIDLIIKEAGVSRGTFYNYFRTNEELFVAVAREVSNEIIRLVEPHVDKQKDPAARVACGVTLVVRLAETYPLFARFMVRGGTLALTEGSLATVVVPLDIAAGMASGRFTVSDERLALDLILGPVMMAFQAVLNGEVSDRYGQGLAEAILRALGSSQAAARKFSSLPFGEIALSEDSLFYQMR